MTIQFLDFLISVEESRGRYSKNKSNIEQVILQESSGSWVWLQGENCWKMCYLTI